MKLEYDCFTDKGSRPVNEDFADFVNKTKSSCFILCDGLGGHGMGDKASRFAVSFIREYFLLCRSTDEFAADVIEKTQNAIHARQQQLGLNGKMKTTGVILVLEPDRALCLHVGDSRIYHFRDAAVRFRTRDHSIPQMLVMTGEISEDEIRNHPDRNKVLRAFGDDHDPLKYDRTELPVKAGDSFLLCSDGFWEPITEQEMTTLLAQSDSVKKWLRGMAKLVSSNSDGKNMDNYTAIAVKIKG